jgi:hypothetical protein
VQLNDALSQFRVQMGSPAPAAAKAQPAGARK